MPNPQYEWLAGNTTVASVNNAGRALALKVGRSNIIVHATDLRENEAKSLLVVVNPDHITLTVEPKESSSDDVITSTHGDVRYLVIGRNYLVRVGLFDADGRTIFYNGTIIFDVAVPNDYFNTIRYTTSHNITEVVGTKTGVTTLTASLDHLVS